MKPNFKNTHLAVEELLREPPAVPVPETPYLGPATVAAVSHKQVELDRPGGRCTARIAVAQSYAPVVGDTMLAISRGTEWYVIDLLEGSGTTTFTAPGDIEFHAPRGRIEMLAKEGVFRAAAVKQARGVRPESQAQVRRHRPRDRECRQAAR